MTTVAKPPAEQTVRPAKVSVPPSAPDTGTSPQVLRRLHLLAVSVALTVLAFVQAPGLIVPDTKADLSIDPVRFLLRAGHLWDPLGDSGQLQNQAYGYFLPMGPFFAAGHLIGLPAWVVQRLWWALVLLVAFHGMYRLCGRFGVGNHPIRIIAALTFALSSRMITELGPVSVEIWPIALAPWVLLPLIKVRRGDEVGAAARSGLAIALCGGVNAVVVGAVLPLPIWWLFTRTRGPLKRKLSRWWALAAVTGMFWWLAPLILLGRYSPPFLDWVESSSVSTSKATLPGAFRGTTQWVAWLQVQQPIWLAGWSVLSSPIGILLGWLLIAVAVLGMLRRDTPNRRFLIGGAVAGLVLMTAGHVGPLTAPWAPAVQHWLDAGGAPLRNTHKFDVVLRVPLTLALAHALARVRVPAIKLPGLPRLPAGSKVLRFIGACALLGTVAPALVGQLPARGSYTKVPNAWIQAADWLKANDDGARTLIVPGSSFATSVWGDPHDEPFQALARTKWATRSAVPLSSAGNIRTLNVIEQQLETGRGSTGLAEILARNGISRVLLRSDLQRSFQVGSPPLPVVVRSALADSPGLTPVVRFGPDLHGTRTADTVADDGLDVPQAQIEIWQVDVPARLVDVERVSDTLRVAGGPESLLTLAEAGRLGSRPVILDGDPEAAALATAARAPLTVTDTIQRREFNVAQVRDNYSQPLTATEPYLTDRRVHDWLPFEAPEVTARYLGINGTTASSQSGISVGPWSAVDGDPTTSWTSSIFAVGQWLEVTFPQPVTLPATIAMIAGPGGAQFKEVRVRTDAGTADTGINSPLGSSQPVSVPPGPTRRLRLTVTRVAAGQELAPVSIADLALPGVTVQRELVLPPIRPTGTTPGSQTAAPASIALQSARDGVDTCVFSNGQSICSSRLRKQSEDSDLIRELSLPVAAGYRVAATARVKASTAADRLLRPDNAMTAAASSRRALDPTLRPDAAVDRDLGTAWIASGSDPRPTLTLTWPRARSITRLRWQVDPSLAASRPQQLLVVAGGKTQTVTPDADGWVSLARVRANRVQLVVTGVRPLTSLDRASGFSSWLPVGASEIVIPGADDFRLAFTGGHPVRTDCGTGTPLLIDGRMIRTRLSGTAQDVLRRRPMAVVPCGAQVQDLPAGPVRLSLQATDLLEPQQLVLDRADAVTAVPPATTAPVSVIEKGSEHRIVTLNASDVARVLIVHENANSGWRATLAGKVLQPVRLDGWQQGWIVPAGAGGAVDLRFTPGTAYRIVLGIGFLLLPLLAGVALRDRLRRLRRSRRERSADDVAVAAELAAAEALGIEPVLQPKAVRDPKPVPDPDPALDPEPGSVPEPGLAPASGHPAAPVYLKEAASGRLDSLLGVAGLLALGGLWGLAAVLAVLVLVRRAVRMRLLVVGLAGLAGIGALFSLNADERGFFGTLSIAASMLIVACLVVRLDAAGSGLLARFSKVIPARKSHG